MISPEALRAALRDPARHSGCVAAARTLLDSPPGRIPASAVLAACTNQLTRYVATWTLYHAAGATAAAAVGDPTGLPPRWATNVRFVQATADLLDGATEDWEGPARCPITLTTHLGLPATRVSVNGHTGLFIVDTGAPTTVVTPAFAAAARLRSAPAAARTVSDGSGREMSAVPAVAEVLAVGAGARRPCPLTILDLPRQLAVDGLLSPWDMARGLTVSLTLPDELVLDFDAIRPSGTGEPLRWVEGTPRVSVRTDGRPVDALLDTGAGMMVIRDHPAQLSAPHTGIGAGGKISLHPAGTMRFTGHDWTATLPVVAKMLRPDPWAVLPDPPDALLGVPLWLNRRITFPADRTLLHATPPLATNRAR